MEKTDRLLLVPARFQWLDVGSWAELDAILAKDAAGNRVEGEAVLVDTEGTYVSAPGLLVAAIGLRDMIVVGSGDALLIVPKSRTQDVRKVVERLAASRRLKYL
jgi:mannose-1-phosphate guanylyltransferase